MARRFGKLILMEMPLLMKQAYALKAKQDKVNKQQLAAALANAQRQRQQSKVGEQRDIFLPNHQNRDPRKQSIWSKWHKISKDMTSVPNNFPQQNSINSANGRKSSSTITSLLANSSAQAMAFITPPFPASQANSFWSHFGIAGNNIKAEEPTTPKDSMESTVFRQKEDSSSIINEGGGIMGNNVSFVEEPPKTHSYETDVSQCADKQPTPQPHVNTTISTDPPTENNSTFWVMPNVDTNPSPLSHRLRQKSAVAAAPNNQQQFQLDHSNNPYGYIPQMAQLASSSSSGGRPAPLFRRATSNSFSDMSVYNCLVDPVVNSTSGASNLAAAAAAAAQLHGSQMQRIWQRFEYDWLAAVLERLFLLMFLSLFF
uniref:Uncharacterized protein n=1 Tax=Ditylenchus dipsaci TaxID=166011 RepID=A0A915ESI3_9BILA